MTVTLDTSYTIKSKRHNAALDYALEQMKKSDISPFIEAVYLFGSCARGQEKWESDVDLLVQLAPSFLQYPELKRKLYLLRAEASTDNLYDVEADIKFVIGTEWESSAMLFYENIKREGKQLWH